MRVFALLGPMGMGWWNGLKMCPRVAFFGLCFNMWGSEHWDIMEHLPHIPLVRCRTLITVIMDHQQILVFVLTTLSLLPNTTISMVHLQRCMGLWTRAAQKWKLSANLTIFSVNSHLQEKCVTFRVNSHSRGKSGFCCIVCNLHRFIA